MLIKVNKNLWNIRLFKNCSTGAHCTSCSGGASCCPSCSRWTLRTALFLLLGAPLMSSSVDMIQCLKRLYLASLVGLQLTLFLMGSTPYLPNSSRTSSRRKGRKGSLLPVIYRIKDMIQHFQKNKSNYFFVLMVFLPASWVSRRWLHWHWDSRSTWQTTTSWSGRGTLQQKQIKINIV